MRNIPSIEQIWEMPIGEISNLPADTLAAFYEEAKDRVEHAKKFQDWMHAAIAHKYEAQSKEIGTHHVQQDGIDVTISVSKGVKWDQEYLRQIHDDLIANGEDPSEYMRAKLEVSETAYNGWPNAIRERFEGARTVEPRKPTFKFKMVDAA